ncbi:MAG: polysaccharide biosynthesis C-terminal domain-containing protein [Lachnospiraceae bacterium]|nr:polysaccharide biosynthesis C-terminal domain-containing protein [Lachnospiraceae bacterium]
MCILSFIILAVGLSNVIGVQYLLPTKRQNIFTLTVCVGAAVNFVLNAAMIPYHKSIGAAVASVIAEAAVATVQFWFVRKELSVVKILLSCWHYLVAGSVMLGVLELIVPMFSATLVPTMIMVIVGGLVYAIMLFILRDSFMIDNLKSIFGRFLRKR